MCRDSRDGLVRAACYFRELFSTMDYNIIVTRFLLKIAYRYKCLFAGRPYELQNLDKGIADVPVRRLSKCLDDKTVRIDT